jgi:hypothetical protein
VQGHQRWHSRGGLAAVVLVAMAVGAPAAPASPAAIDQYTERPPSGPGGGGTLQTGGDRSSPGGAPRGGGSGADDETATAGGSPAGGSGPDGGRAPDRNAVVRQPAVPHLGSGALPAPGAETAARTAGPGSEGDELPLIGYPSTTLVSALALLIGAALLLRLGIAVHHRRSTAGA